MTTEEMKRRKEEPDLTSQALAETCGGSDTGDQNSFREAAAYAVRGSFTLEDYLVLPEGVRVELIDGVFYDMAAPTTWHQAVAEMICSVFLDHVRRNRGLCFPFISPVDVQLDRDDKTVVQPDVMIVCDRAKYREGRIFGAPDMIAEILSPSTRSLDMKLKLYKYRCAGVREYWIVDLENRRVIQYDLENGSTPEIYSLCDKVPVLIWDGACAVDFQAIVDSMGFLWEESSEE